MAANGIDHYLGSFANDAAANAELAANGWTAFRGLLYYDSTLSVLKFWDGAAWIQWKAWEAFPGIELEQVIFVDEGSNAAGSADGSAAAPYQTIAAGYAQAKTLSPTATNPVTVFIWGGVYDETLTLDTSYINLVGIGRDSVLIRETAATDNVVTIEDIICEISNLSIISTVSGYPAVRFNGSGAEVRFNSVYFEGPGNTDAQAVIYCPVLANVEFIDCDIYATGNVMLYATTESQWRFYSCRYYSLGGYGLLHFENADFMLMQGCSSVSRNGTLFGCVKISDGDGKYRFMDCFFGASQNSGQIAVLASSDIDLVVSGCVFENSSMRWSDGGIIAKVVGCTWRTHIQSYDIQQQPVLTNPAEVTGCEMCKGMNSRVKITDRVKRVCDRASGWGTFYNTFNDAVQSVWEDDAVVQLNKDYPLQFDGTITLSVARKFVVDGQGTFGWTKTAGTNAFLFSAGADVTFHRCINMSGDIQLNYNGAKCRLVESQMVGTINVSSGDSAALVSIEGSHLVGETNSQYAVDLTDPDVPLFVTRSYLKGDDGDPAIDNPNNNTSIKISWSTIMHGSLSTNSPLAAPGTPAYSSHHNMYNADPSGAGYVNDITNPYDSFDVNGDWDWGL